MIWFEVLDIPLFEKVVFGKSKAESSYGPCSQIESQEKVDYNLVFRIFTIVETYDYSAKADVYVLRFTSICFMIY